MGRGGRIAFEMVKEGSNLNIDKSAYAIHFELVR